jgi:hypothetical protein
MDKHIFLPIHRLMCKFFNGLGDNTVVFGEYCREADSWIDCWVGCANVIVHSQLRVGACFSAWLGSLCDVGSRIGLDIFTLRLNVGSQ